MKSEKYISVDKAAIAKLMKIFGVGERCIKNALTGRSDNDLAKRIRMAAMENGGVVYRVGADMECFFDHDGVMHQIFPNGAELEIDTHTGYGQVTFKGRRIVGYDNIKVRQIPAIQAEAAKLR